MHDQLYRQFLMRKKQKISAKHIQNNQKSKRRSILKKFFEFKDDDLVSLESSVPILKSLSIIKHIDNVDHIVSIMQAKRSSNSQNVKNQQLLQCRLIYFLWAVIENEAIQMREFKDVVMLLLSDQNRGELMRDRFGDKDGIQQLIQCWDQIFKPQASFMSGSVDKSYNEIQDISIIRSKNEIKNDQNKENCSYFQQTLDKADTSLTHSRSKLKIRSKNQQMNKSFHKRQERQYLDASRSLQKQASKKSGQFSITSSGNVTKKINFYSNYESLTVQQEKTLVSRLYRTDKYKQRQELKKIYEEERLKAELNECSFKPKVVDRSRAMSREKIATKQVRGYQKAVQRMKSGYKKTKQFKDNLEYRIWRESNQNKQTHVQPPTFLNRKKEAPHELFQIVFTIGRHNIRIKVKESDKISDIVNNMGQIYTLKEENKAQIRKIIEQQVSNYYQANSRLNTDPQQMQ